MASFSVSGVRIAGMAASVPKKMEKTMDYSNISEKERKMLIRLTGVEQKRIAEPEMTTADLCYEATDKLLNKLKWDRNEVTLLVFVSQSGDYFLPATAVILQDRLGLPKSCMAFDIGLGCSGFVYGLSIIASLMQTSRAKKALLLTGDISSVICSVNDKSTYPLFGDAGTVTALELQDDANSMYFNLNSDGKGHQAIIVPHGRGRYLGTTESFKEEKISEGIVRSKLHIALNGIDVFNFSIREVPALIRNILNETKTTVKDYDYLVLHQANKLINETVRKKSGFEPHQVPYSIGKYGNTSSASIPLTIVSELGNEVNAKELSFLCVGFGVGLSWGAASFKTNNIVTLPVIEI